MPMVPMTEYELIDAINSSSTVAITASMAFVTLSTAYAVAIHLVGRKLPGFFLWALAIGYSLYAALPVFGNFKALNEGFFLRAQLEALRAGISVPDVLPTVYYSTVVLLYFWVLCMVYTVYVRRNR